MWALFSAPGISPARLLPNATRCPVLVCAQVTYPELSSAVIWSLIFFGRLILVGVRVWPVSFICPFEVSPQQYSPVLVAAQVWAAPMVKAVISPLPVSTAVGVAGVLFGLPVACPVSFFPQQYTLFAVAAQVVERPVAMMVIGLCLSSSIS